MKKILSLLLIGILLLSGCGKTEKQPSIQMGNPWSDHKTLAEAENAVGFSLELPETVADTYQAAVFRTLNGQLLEVVYADGDYEVTVRKQIGEGQDISGDYNDYPNVTKTHMGVGTLITKNDGTACLTLIYHDGYSYSLSAPNGYWGDSMEDFICLILA